VALNIKIKNMKNLILIGVGIYYCSDADLKKLKGKKERYELACMNESSNVEEINEELYKLEMEVKSRSKLIDVLRYKS
jgi:hypothetical protein